MSKINVALLVGGDSSEREISVGSGTQIYKSLDRSKYNTYLIDIRGGDWNYMDDAGVRWQVDKNDFSLTISADKVLLDYAFIIIHGTPGEDGKIQGYLDVMGVSYSSGGVASSVLTFDKITCKRTVAPTGVALARDIYIRKGEGFDAERMVKELWLPMFIKPNASGSSCGVTKVTKIEQLKQAVSDALRESDSVLAEEMIEGREVGCGVLITKRKEYVFPVTEIITKKEFFNYEAKYTPGAAEEITPADISEEIASELRRRSLEIYKACDCRGVVRIDYIIKADGVIVLIEVNSVPGMSSGSIVPQQVRVAGMTLGELCDLIIEDTYEKRK